MAESFQCGASMPPIAFAGKAALMAGRVCSP
jgi:hypothetical protein